MWKYGELAGLRSLPEVRMGGGSLKEDLELFDNFDVHMCPRGKPQVNQLLSLTFQVRLFSDSPGHSMLPGAL